MVIVFGDGFPDQLLGAFEARASARSPHLALKRLVSGNWKIVPARDLQCDAMVSLVLNSLETLLVAPDRVRLVPPRELAALNVVTKSAPREDPELTRRLREVYRGELQATVATVAIELIEVTDPAYALRVRESIIDAFVERAKAPTPPRLLLYWDGVRYRSSDDHVAYMAYRQLRVQTVEATILGSLGPVVSIGAAGGPELIPDPLVMSSPPDEVLANWKWQLRQEHEDVSYGALKLNALYLQLATLVASPTVEADLHRVLRSSPLALDAYGNRLLSEVRLGSEYRVDLALEYTGSDAHVLLVELESATHLLFTRKGRWRAPIVHAIQQVEDWLRWWHEHPDRVPNGWDASLPIKGLVVAGRRRDLQGEQEQRLVQLNRGKQIQVITYDDLLDRIERLLSST